MKWLIVICFFISVKGFALPDGDEYEFDLVSEIEFFKDDQESQDRTFGMSHLDYQFLKCSTAQVGYEKPLELITKINKAIQCDSHEQSESFCKCLVKKHIGEKVTGLQAKTFLSELKKYKEHVLVTADEAINKLIDSNADVNSYESSYVPEQCQELKGSGKYKYIADKTSCSQEVLRDMNKYNQLPIGFPDKNDFELEYSKGKITNKNTPQIELRHGIKQLARVLNEYLPEYNSAKEFDVIAWRKENEDRELGKKNKPFSNMQNKLEKHPVFKNLFKKKNHRLSRIDNFYKIFFDRITEAAPMSKGNQISENLIEQVLTTLKDERMGKHREDNCRELIQVYDNYCKVKAKTFALNNNSAEDFLNESYQSQRFSKGEKSIEEKAEWKNTVDRLYCMDMENSSNLVSKDARTVFEGIERFNKAGVVVSNFSKILEDDEEPSDELALANNSDHSPKIIRNEIGKKNWADVARKIKVLGSERYIESSNLEVAQVISEQTTSPLESNTSAGFVEQNHANGFNNKNIQQGLISNGSNNSFVNPIAVAPNSIDKIEANSEEDIVNNSSNPEMINMAKELAKLKSELATLKNEKSTATKVAAQKEEDKKIASLKSEIATLETDINEKKQENIARKSVEASSNNYAASNFSNQKVDVPTTRTQVAQNENAAKQGSSSRSSNVEAARVAPGGSSRSSAFNDKDAYAGNENGFNKQEYDLNNALTFAYKARHQKEVVEQKPITLTLSEFKSDEKAIYKRSGTAPLIVREEDMFGNISAETYLPKFNDEGEFLSYEIAKSGETVSQVKRAPAQVKVVEKVQESEKKPHVRGTFHNDLKSITGSILDN